jgi:hypothetical protein
MIPRELFRQHRPDQQRGELSTFLDRVGLGRDRATNPIVAVALAIAKCPSNFACDGPQPCAVEFEPRKNQWERSGTLKNECPLSAAKGVGLAGTAVRLGNII